MATTQRVGQPAGYIQGGIPKLKRQRPLAAPELLRSNTLPTKINQFRISNDPVLSPDSGHQRRLSRNRRTDTTMIKRDSIESNRSDSSDPGIGSSHYTVSLSKTVGGGPLRRGAASFSISSKDKLPSTSTTAKKTRSKSLDQETSSLSTSSILFTKIRSMKEKIERQVVQTVQVGDWPPPCVLFNDRHIYSSSVPSTIKRKKSNSTRGYLERSSSVTKSVTNSSDRETSRSSIMSDTYSSKSFSSSGIGGIVCSEIDLKAIIVGFRQQNSQDTVEVKPTVNTFVDDRQKKTKSETQLNESKPRKRWIRKQVSFDDKERVIPTERKVSAIAEEIEMALGENALSLQARRRSSTKNEDKTMPSTKTKTATRTNQLDASYCSQQIDRKQSLEMSDNIEEDPDVIFHPKEVEYDEFGQTWEIYGADPDPEILGQAIQYHLEHLMLNHETINSDKDSTDEDEETERPQNQNMDNNVSSSGFKRFWSRLFCITDRGAATSCDNIRGKNVLHDTQVC